MKTTTGGYEILFGLVVEFMESGKKVKKIVDRCGLKEVPFIGITIRKIDPECREYFEVKNEEGCIKPYKKRYNFWKFLSPTQATVTVWDTTTGRGYEFSASFQQNDHYTKLHVSRSKLFGSDVVTVEQLTQALIEVAERSRKRRTRPTNEAVQQLIQKFNGNSVRSSQQPISTSNGEGNGSKNKVSGYFADLYREAKADPSPAF